MIILPKNYSERREDAKWIKEQLQTIADLTSYSAAQKAANKYSAAYAEALERAKVSGAAEYKIKNIAIFEANNRLRLYVEAIKGKYKRLTN